MNINFENKNIPVYSEISCQTKIVQEICEAVVPDTDDDIARIAAVQSSVQLKSKDITGRGVLITGEASASLLYISDQQDKVSAIKLKKTFSIEYELNDISSEAVAQIKLSVLSAEARLINPRKVSVCFEISGEMNCYSIEEISVEQGLPADCSAGVHTKYETANINVITAVCEKTFSLSEQFSFPAGKPKPSKPVCANAELVVSDTQLVGTKAVVKGTLNIALCYFSDEVNYPVKTEFSTGFSQIIDLSGSAADSCFVIPALSGLYYNFTDGIGGDKLMDMEIHGVLQLVCRSGRELLYISDAYSNLMNIELMREKKQINYVSELRRMKMSTDERFDIEDCSDMLSIFVSLVHVQQDTSKISAQVRVEMIYRDSNGMLSSAGRHITLETDVPSEHFRIHSTRLTDIYLRPDGQFVDCRISLELECTICAVADIEKLSEIKLCEDERVELDAYPTLSLVRCSGESLWELAKLYHSSVERISASNDVEGSLEGKMILVPKCI